MEDPFCPSPNKSLKRFPIALQYGRECFQDLKQAKNERLEIIGTLLERLFSSTYLIVCVQEKFLVAGIASLSIADLSLKLCSHREN